MVPAVPAGNSAERRERSRSLCGLAHSVAGEEKASFGIYQKQAVLKKLRACAAHWRSFSQEPVLQTPQILSASGLTHIASHPLQEISILAGADREKLPGVVGVRHINVAGGVAVRGGEQRQLQALLVVVLYY